MPGKRRQGARYWEKKASLNRLIRPKKTRRIGHKKTLPWKTNRRIIWQPRGVNGKIRVQLCDNTTANKVTKTALNYIEIFTGDTFMDRFDCMNPTAYLKNTRNNCTRNFMDRFYKQISEQTDRNDTKMDFYSFARLDSGFNGFQETHVEQKVVIIQNKDDLNNEYQFNLSNDSLGYCSKYSSTDSGYFSPSTNSMDVIIGGSISSPPSDFGFMSEFSASPSLDSETTDQMEIVETECITYTPSLGCDSFSFHSDYKIPCFDFDSGLDSFTNNNVIDTPDLKFDSPIQDRKMMVKRSRWDQLPQENLDHKTGSINDSEKSCNNEESSSVVNKTIELCSSRCTTPGSQRTHSVIDLCSPYSIPEVDNTTRELTTVFCRDILDFHVISFVSKGAFGSVFKAADVDTGRIVAIKKVNLGMSLEENKIPVAIYREIKTQWMCDHPNVAKLESVASGKNLDVVYLVMEYLENDMYSLLSNLTQPLPTDEVKSLMRDLFTGVSYLHQNGIMHRDLKPSNLLIDSHGVLKIADFGLAREIVPGMQEDANESTEKECLTPVVVTLWYRAPEVLLGTKHYGKAVDIWSVGCIMSEFITCKPLFKGRSDLDQIKRIFEIRGVPTEQEWPEFGDLPGTRVCHFPKQKRLSLRKIMQCVDNVDLTDNAFDLIDRCLTFDPSKRVESRDALEHEWFHEYSMF